MTGEGSQKEETLPPDADTPISEQPAWQQRLRRHYMMALIWVVGLLMAGEMISDGYLRYTRVQHIHIDKLQDTAKDTARQIEHRLAGLRTGVQLFADAHSELLSRIKAHPGDEALVTKLNGVLGSYFPYFHGVTFTDNDGRLMIDDFGEKVGDLCRHDIDEFTQSDMPYEPYIHPGPQRFHFDIMVPLRHNDKRTGTFFASFAPELISQLLLVNENEGFRLVLTRADMPTLIEISDEGSRDRITSATRLTAQDETLDRLPSIPIADTRWVVRAIPSPEFLAQLRNEQIRISGTAVALVLSLTILVSFLVHRLERRRHQAETTLREAKDMLEIRVAERTRDLSTSNEELRNEIAERERIAHQMRKIIRAVEQTADSIMITNSAGVIEYVNRAFEEITGYSRQEAVGATPSLNRSGKHDLNYYENLWATILSGQTFRDVTINRRKTGELYYEEKTITPLLSSEGKITHFVATGKDITERVEFQERLQYLAHHDILTDLPNRALFQDRLEHAMVNANRQGQMIGLLFIDLDNFKDINDTYGHTFGDQLLEGVARRIQSVVRDSDTVARIGGDEFTVVLEAVHGTQAAAHVAEKTLEAIALPYKLEDIEVFVNASIGITIFPDDAIELDTLCRNADTAMYRAKDLGRNRYQFFTASMTEETRERVEMATRLRLALSRDQFSLHYQPKVDLQTQQVCGFEALLRWNSPDLGMVPPDRFIPLLEETGLIVEVGRWVIDTACRFAAELQAADHRLPIAVNLSTRQIRDEGLIDYLLDTISVRGLTSRYLGIEITESLIIENFDEAVPLLRGLHDKGINISVDDFGTGYSSLGYLQKLPIDTLKIDRTFIRNITVNHRDAAIAGAIIAMARGLGLSTVAEGVETEEQMVLVKKLGCETAQGFLYARPMAPHAVLEFLRGQEHRLLA